MGEADRRKQQARAEEEARRKAEEEADDLLMRAFENKPNAADSSKVDDDRRKRGRSRSLSRSRSISSRTARRNTRQKPPPSREPGWASQRGSAPLTGSRAILLNKDFVEDLPHMSRPQVPGTMGVGPRRSLSRSRERSRGRRG